MSTDSTDQTTTVDLVIRLQVKGTPAEVAKHLGALQCLASVMAMQAEDGLWSAGHPDGDTVDGPSEYVADIDRAYEQSVRIDGEIAWTAEGGA
jgi:hypothetical protein